MTSAPAEPDAVPTLRHRLEDAATGALIWLALRLPYRSRVPAFGWFSRTVLGPLAMNRRVRENLLHVFPDLPRAEIRRICRSVADNFGRSFIELHSGPVFAARAAT